MVDPDGIQQFNVAYDDYVRRVLLPTHNALKRLLKEWIARQYWEKYRDPDARVPAQSPVQRAFPRIKRPESVIDKIRRKPDSFPDGVTIDSVKRMPDAVAGRVVLYFLSGFPLIDREIHNHPNLEIAPHDAPVAYLAAEVAARLGLSHLKRVEKHSGYASVHYVLRLRHVPALSGPSPWFELQVRTLAEDAWGEIEHILGYKPDKRTSFAVKQQFRIIGAILSAIDQHFNFLHEELRRFQQEVQFKESDLLNAENLPAALADCGISCTQRDIDGALKALTSAGVMTVGRLHAVATPHRRDVINNTYLTEEGRSPTNFEVVAGLAAIAASTDPHDAEIVRANIRLLRTWKQLQADMQARPESE